ncbi:hypothetical protein CC1G_03130 [Coprinopsis cinerea okayama7|uniref:Uncharacterized protein n=1 Tax=Coprinopsis cinerea (strain Okayama-7 / 130 / ATCC MYA-4618 / FGSC 9003) TaxID=240176 RepID=A8PF18_COPC7|nr:hypothetical protein CC1G_03130 [Coprinopsis cinerea okayama7\|eukprot:XP_001840901.1 hypothetical protein CC1G_03130 [Coprinopsis cinerea okayama7\
MPAAFSLFELLYGILSRDTVENQRMAVEDPDPEAEATECAERSASEPAETAGRPTAPEAPTRGSDSQNFEEWIIRKDNASISSTATVERGWGNGHVFMSGDSQISGNARVTAGHYVAESLEEAEKRWGEEKKRSDRELEALRVKHRARMAALEKARNLE